MKRKQEKDKEEIPKKQKIAIETTNVKNENENKKESVPSTPEKGIKKESPTTPEKTIKKEDSTPTSPSEFDMKLTLNLLHQKSINSIQKSELYLHLQTTKEYLRTLLTTYIRSEENLKNLDFKDKEKLFNLSLPIQKKFCSSIDEFLLPKVVRVGFFGKTGYGKSYVINSLLRKNYAYSGKSEGNLKGMTLYPVLFKHDEKPSITFEYITLEDYKKRYKELGILKSEEVVEKIKNQRFTKEFENEKELKKELDEIFSKQDIIMELSHFIIKAKFPLLKENNIELLDIPGYPDINSSKEIKKYRDILIKDVIQLSDVIVKLETFPGRNQLDISAITDLYECNAFEKNCPALLFLYNNNQGVNQSKFDELYPIKDKILKQNLPVLISKGLNHKILDIDEEDDYKVKSINEEVEIYQKTLSIDYWLRTSKLEIFFKDEKKNYNFENQLINFCQQKVLEWNHEIMTKTNNYARALAANISSFKDKIKDKSTVYYKCYEIIKMKKLNDSNRFKIWKNERSANKEVVRIFKGILESEKFSSTMTIDLWKEYLEDIYLSFSNKIDEIHQDIINCLTKHSEKKNVKMNPLNKDDLEKSKKFLQTQIDYRKTLLEFYINRITDQGIKTPKFITEIFSYLQKDRIHDYMNNIIYLMKRNTNLFGVLDFKNMEQEESKLLTNTIDEFLHVFKDKFEQKNEELQIKRSEYKIEPSKHWEHWDTYPIPKLSQSKKTLRYPPSESNKLSEVKKYFGSRDQFISHFSEFQKYPRSSIVPIIKESKDENKVKIDFKEKDIIFEISENTKSKIEKFTEKLILKETLPPILISSIVRKNQNFEPNFYLKELSKEKSLNSLLFIFLEEKEKDENCYKNYFDAFKEYTSKNVVLFYLKDNDMGIGRKRTIMMMLMNLFNFPFYYIIDDDLYNYEEYTPFLFKHESKDYSFLRSLFYLKQIMYHESLPEGQPNKIEAFIEENADLIYNEKNNPDIYKLLANKQRIEAFTKDPSQLIQKYPNSNFIQKFCNEFQKKVGQVALFSNSSHSGFSKVQMGDILKSNEGFTHKIWNSRYQCVLYNANVIRNLFPVSDKCFFKIPLKFEESQSLVKANKMSKEGKEAMLLGYSNSEDAYIRLLTLYGIGGCICLYFTTSEKKNKSAIKEERNFTIKEEDEDDE